MASRNLKPRTCARPDLLIESEPLARRIRDLKRERAKLEQEILQLRAAVQVWTEVCRQRVAAAGGVRRVNLEIN